MDYRRTFFNAAELSLGHAQPLRDNGLRQRLAAVERVAAVRPYDAAHMPSSERLLDCRVLPEFGGHVEWCGETIPADHLAGSAVTSGVVARQARLVSSFRSTSQTPKKDQSLVATDMPESFYGPEVTNSISRY